VVAVENKLSFTPSKLIDGRPLIHEDL